MRHCFVLLFTCIIPVSALAQSGWKYSPGQEPASKPKVLQRMEYFHDRVAPAVGEVPVGERVKAYYNAQNLSRYAPKENGVQASLEWKNVGPRNIGGRVFALALNPKNPSTVYAGAADGGVWRSYDGSLSWESVSEDFPTLAMGSLVVNPIDTNIVYAGTGDASFGGRSFDGAGMFKSTNGGTTWTKVGDGTLPEFGRVSDMAINPASPDVLYAAIPDGVSTVDQMGIWRTRDGGSTWSNVLTGRMTDVVIDPQNPSVLYTVSSKMFGSASAQRYGMFKTTDGGDTWFKLDIGVVDSLMGRTAIGICAGNPNVLYIGVSEITGGETTPLLGVFKTTNAGASWTKLDVPFDYMASQGWFDNIIGVHPTNPDIVFAGGVKLIRSSDGGATWERMPDQLAGGILHVDQHEIEFDPRNPDRVFIGNDGGLFLTTQNGTAWEKRDIGMSITQFIGGALHPSQDALLFGGSQDNGTKISFAQPSFEQVLYGDGGNGAINPKQPNILYTTQERLKLWRSDDFGRTWSWAVGNLPNDQSLFYIALDMDWNDPSTLYLGTYRMYKTTDEGRSWRQLQTCLFPVGNSCYFITAVSVTPYDGRVVLAGAPGAVAMSFDAGTTWNLRGSGTLPIASMSSVHSVSPGVLYATFSTYGVEKVWRSSDYGNTWSSLNGNLPNLPVNDIIALDGKLVIATDLGTFISENADGQWQRFGTGMPALSVQKLKYNANTGTLRAFTHGRGLYDLQWKDIPQSAPQFLSRPDTTMLLPGQWFTYAPVVTASPQPSFELLEAPSRATIDPKLGVVRWDASDLFARFTIRASNGAGSTTQTFSLSTGDVITTDWAIVSSTPTSTAVNYAAASPDRSLWMARDTGWVSRSVDLGHTWQHLKLPTNASVISIAALDKNTAYAGTGGPQSLVNTGSGHIWKTTDGGATWTAVLYGIDSRFGNLHFKDALNGLALSQGQKGLTEIFRTTDGGATWGRQQGPFARIPLYNTLEFTDEQNGWFASSNEYASPASDAVVLHTTDGGLTWTERTAGPSIRYVSSIAFLTKDKGWLVEEMGGRIRRTANGGSTWNTSFYPMNGLRTVAAHADPSAKTIWILTDTSAWVSDNDGSTWRRTELIPSGAMQSLAYADTAHIWAVTKTGIVQQYLARGPVNVKRLPAARDIHLGDAYPHPIIAKQREVLIPWTLRSRKHLTLKILNMQGRELATLAEGSFVAGEHVAVWSAGDVAPGVYYIQLNAGSERISKSIVIIR